MSLDDYVHALRKHPRLSKAEEQEINDAYARGAVTPALRTRLVEGNLRFVVVLARRLARAFDCDTLDLVQEGNLGLLRAADRYDPRQGRFITYASWWIRSFQHHYLTNNAGLVPCKRGSVAYRLRLHATQVLWDLQAAGVAVSVEAVAQKLAEKPEAVAKYFPFVAEESDLDLDTLDLDPLTSGTPWLEQRALCAKVRAAVLQLAQQLPPRDGAIVRNLLAADPNRNELAHKIGVSRQRIQQLEDRYLERLRPRLQALVLE